MSENLTVEITDDEEFFQEKVCPFCEQEKDFDLLSEPHKEKIRRQIQLAGVWTAIWDFVSLVSNTHEPYMTRLCFVDRKTKEPIGKELPSISIWAGVGEMTPISRLEQKNEQINKLEQYLYKEVIPQVIELNKEIAELQKDWTPISEGLPEYSGDYLVQLENGKTRVAMFESKPGMEPRFTLPYAEHSHSDVIAYRPLPSAYEGEGK